MTDSSDIDNGAWIIAMDQLCADSLSEDEDTMRRAIDEHRMQAKEQTRREMEQSFGIESRNKSIE